MSSSICSLVPGAAFPIRQIGSPTFFLACVSMLSKCSFIFFFVMVIVMSAVVGKYHSGIGRFFSLFGFVNGSRPKTPVDLFWNNLGSRNPM